MLYWQNKDNGLTYLCHIYTVHKLMCHSQSNVDWILPTRNTNIKICCSRNLPPTAPFQASFFLRFPNPSRIPLKPHTLGRYGYFLETNRRNLCYRRCGPVVSTLNGSSTDRGHCVVSLDKTINYRSASLQ